MTIIATITMTDSPEGRVVEMIYSGTMTGVSRQNPLWMTGRGSRTARNWNVCAQHAALWRFSHSFLTRKMFQASTVPRVVLSSSEGSTCVQHSPFWSSIIWSSICFDSFNCLSFLLFLKSFLDITVRLGFTVTWATGWPFKSVRVSVITTTVGLYVTITHVGVGQCNNHRTVSTTNLLSSTGTIEDVQST